MFSQFEAPFSFRISTERFCFSGSDLCISDTIWDCFSCFALRASLLATPLSLLDVCCVLLLLIENLIGQVAMLLVQV